jgi:hypothetical protein
MSITVDTSELKRLERSMKRAGKDFEKGANRMLKKLGVWVQGRAKDRCPESPTISQYKEMNQDGTTLRDRSSITTGSLRDSITMEQGKLQVHIGIPSNSRGGKYGRKIHDEKGKSWQNFGPQSKTKPDVSDKFIFKAADDSKKVQGEMVDAVIDEFTRGIGL